MMGQQQPGMMGQQPGMLGQQQGMMMGQQQGMMMGQQGMMQPGMMLGQSAMPVSESSVHRLELATVYLDGCFFPISILIRIIVHYQTYQNATQTLFSSFHLFINCHRACKPCKVSPTNSQKTRTSHCICSLLLTLLFPHDALL